MAPVLPQPELSIDGVESTVDLLQGLGERADDMRPATRQIRELLKRGHREQFRSKGAYLGTPWPADSDATIERKSRLGVPGLMSTMVLSGELQEAAEGGKGSSGSATRSLASAGVRIFYARFHIDPKRAGMPPRPVVGIHPKDEARSLRIVEEHLLGFGLGGGLRL